MICFLEVKMTSKTSRPPTRAEVVKALQTLERFGVLGVVNPPKTGATSERRGPRQTR